MNKYPYILFYRHEPYANIDEFIKENESNFQCTFSIVSSVDDVNKLYNPNHHLLITYGDSYSEYEYLCKHMPSRFSRRWIHKSHIKNIEEFNSNVNYCYIHNVIQKRIDTRPIFSIFTTCYKSYDYIDTAYDSIKNQSLLDWEWVIMDDTPEAEHFTFLKDKLGHDNRVRLYKRDKNSGNIGNVKNEAISLCRGKYILEMDHDDEILRDCLSDAYAIFQKDDKIGFVYGDTINLYRNGENYKYSDFICKGYGGYYMQKMRGQWMYVYITPHINNITLSHLVCLPNHPRIWKRSVLMELESYSEFLPICDDYEIILRTCCSEHKVAKMNKPQYIQYMNDGGNNFSNIRNTEINRLGPQYISPMFYTQYQVHDKMKGLNAYEDETYITHHSQIWKRNNNYIHCHSNSIYNFDYDKQYCIINDAIHNEGLDELYHNPRNDILFLTNRLSHSEMCEVLDSKGYSNMKCYSYVDSSEEELVTFFNMLYVNDNCDTEIVSNDTLNDISIHNITFCKDFTSRADIINSIIMKNENVFKKYLEIGVEYGQTFQNVNIETKIGVDPDSKFIDESIVLKTSDAFFAENIINDSDNNDDNNDDNKNNTDNVKYNHTFDVIFIDGMHQSDYVFRDFKNSLSILNENGVILLDDVLPLTYNEQLQIPRKHYYENGILKYGESWTGDVWKFLYYVLIHYYECIELQIYNHTNYRGVCKIKIIQQIDWTDEEQVINTMIKYDYTTDFSNFLQILGNRVHE